MSGHLANHPVSLEHWLAYFADELGADDAAALEEHMMSCAECTRFGERVVALTGSIRALIAPLLLQRDVDALRARGLVVVDNPLPLGERRLATFEAHVDVLLHRLQGLDLSAAQRVDVTIRVENGGPVLATVPNAPFERATGEVLVACQKHFAVYPPDIEIEVRAFEDDGATKVAEWHIPHAFAAGLVTS